MLDSTEPRKEQQPWRKPNLEANPGEHFGFIRAGPDSSDSRWNASSISTPASNGTASPAGLIKASPWPDVPVETGRLRSPIMQEGEDWYAIDVVEPEASGPSDPDLYNMPMVPKGPGRIDSAADDPNSNEGGECPPPPRATGPGRDLGCGDPCGCMWRGGGAVCHVLSLLVAERPLRKHREWAGKLVPDARPDADYMGPDSPTTPPTKGSLRRKLTFQAVSNGRLMERPDERKYPQNDKKRRLAYALRRKQARSYTSLWDRLGNEVFILGEAVFDLCTPLRMDSHLPWITSAFIALNLITFTFMAGEYSAYIAAQPVISTPLSKLNSGGTAPAPAPKGLGGIRPVAPPPNAAAHLPRAPSVPCPASLFGSGPQALLRWASHWDACFRFRPEYLFLWGARRAGLMQGGAQWWRWGSSLLVVDSAPHLAAQALLLAALGLHLEPRYGSTRILLLLIIGGLAGNFLDAAALDVCRLGLPGAAVSFSLLTLFLGDFLFNFESIRYPFLRLLAFLGCLGAFIAAALLTGYPSGLVPVGAVLATLFPGALFLPHLKSEKYEWFVPYLTLLSLLALMGAVPAFLYLHSIPHAIC
eukprot:jgi/Botrbrau1/5719/Bobra.0071s0050.2